MLSTRNSKQRLVSTRHKSGTMHNVFKPGIAGGEGVEVEDDGDDFSKRFGDLFTGTRNAGFSSHSKTSRKKTFIRANGKSSTYNKQRAEAVEDSDKEDYDNEEDEDDEEYDSSLGVESFLYLS